MKATYTLLVMLGAASVWAADAPEVRNGDFEKGKQFWRGDGRIVTEAAGNKVCELKTSERKGDEITQDIDTGKAAQVEISLRVKGLDYTGAGLRVAMQKRSGGSTYNIRQVTNGSWTDVKWTYVRNSTDEKFTLVLSPTVGSGSIQIDDVKVSAGAANSPNLKP